MKAGMLHAVTGCSPRIWGCVHVQMCQDPVASTGEREAAVRVLHTVLSDRHWPEHHACLAGAALLRCRSL